MPDTPIDLSEGIQSVRLKVPTAEVPIPPEGFAQLHSPAPGELALRLPDGSVVAVGGGGDFALAARNLLGPNGQILTNGTEPGVGIDISPIPPLTIRLNGPTEDANGQPQAPDAVTLVEQDPEPSSPDDGSHVWYMTPDGALHHLDVGGPAGFVFSDGAGGILALAGGAGGFTTPTGGTFEVTDGVLLQATDNSFAVNPVSIILHLGGGGNVIVQGLPTADPAVAGALWIAPVTRQLMVSAG